MMILSLAYSRSAIETTSFSSSAAFVRPVWFSPSHCNLYNGPHDKERNINDTAVGTFSAAVLTRLESSAPENPAVPRAMEMILMSSSIGIFSMYSSRICQKSASANCPRMHKRRRRWCAVR
jgi:hypothetical protein